MAWKFAIKSGNWSATDTWGANSNTATMHASTNITINAGTTYLSAVFTAPNTTNANLGALIYLASAGAGAGAVTLKLQEYNGSTWVDCPGATATINIADWTAANGIFFKFATPYVYTTTTAGRYRYAVTRTASTTSPTFAADSGGSNFHFWAIDNRGGAPVAGDDVMIPGENYLTPITVTMDGACAMGSGLTKNTAATARSITAQSLYIFANGVLKADTTQTSSMTLLGNCLIYNYGTRIIGTKASPIPAAYTFTWTQSQTDATNNYGTWVSTLASDQVNGRPLTFWRSTITSGVGTAASPLVTADSVDWSVGDEVIFPATSDNATNYNETETRFIITKNSATSYVLSATAGGAESALAYTHTEVLNLTRNVIFTTSNTSYGWYLNNQCTVNGNVQYNWVRGRYPGYTTTPVGGNAFGLVTGLGAYCEADYSVVTEAKNNISFNVSQSKTVCSHTGLIVANSASAGSGGGFYASNAYNKIFNDCYALNMYAPGITAMPYNTYNRCKAIACNLSNTYGGVQGGGAGTVFNSCEIHANRNAGINMNQAVGTFNLCNIGTKGKNTRDIYCQTDFINTALFSNCNFGSDVFVYNYTLSGEGTLVAFHNLNGVTNKHRYYTNRGIAQATGAGLTDTNVRTSNSLAIRLAPEEATTGLLWSFKIVAKANSAVSITGFIQKNAAFGTDAVVTELWLPGSTTYDKIYTMPNDITWDVFTLAANNTAVVDGFATVKIYAKSAAAGAYCYVDDLYNGTNKLTAIDVWDSGQPSPIMFEQLGDSAAVWAQDPTTFVPGSVGDKITKIKNDTAIIPALL